MGSKKCLTYVHMEHVSKCIKPILSGGVEEIWSYICGCTCIQFSLWERITITADTRTRQAKKNKGLFWEQWKRAESKMWALYALIMELTQSFVGTDELHKQLVVSLQNRTVIIPSSSLPASLSCESIKWDSGTSKFIALCRMPGCYPQIHAQCAMGNIPVTSATDPKRQQSLVSINIKKQHCILEDVTKCY